MRNEHILLADILSWQHEEELVQISFFQLLKLHDNFSFFKTINSANDSIKNNCALHTEIHISLDKH